MTGKEPVLLLIVLAIVAVHIACTEKMPANASKQTDPIRLALENNPQLQFFSANHPGQPIVTYAQADLDNDGRKDLIVIYRSSESKNHMCVIRTVERRLVETNPVPAPVSDQMIQFRDIDEKPPLEFIVQGRKGAKVGYAIFRVEQGRLTDLFGDGMEDCC